jgi:hypothetical protein
MKFVNELLFLEFSELVACGVSENTIFQAKRRNSSSWNFTDDPDDRRKVLIGYEKLNDQYKELVQKTYGNPYDFIAKQPIRDLLQKDFKAEEFYRTRLTELKVDVLKLNQYVTQYTTAASWLNLLIKLNADKKFIKKTLNLSLDKFYESVCEIIEQDKIDLPSSYRRLRAKMDEYSKESYACLIDWRFGNKLAAKIGKAEGEFDEELAAKQEAIIRKAKSLHNNFDAAQITRAVNIIFEKNNWLTVSEGTVKNVLAKYEHITTPGARGKRNYDSTIAMQVKRKAPEFPLLYCTLDGWTVELLYQDEKGYNNRMVMVVVLDACKKYPLGYAIGDRENTELIKQANRNAIIHLQDIFGKPYYPMQLQSDHYGLKTLTPFYEAMAHLHTPAAVGNAKSKIIEPYFKYLNKKYCQYFPNWSGFNINARKENQPNTEYLDKIKKTFPSKEGVIKQIELIMQQERRLKFGEYREQFNIAPAEIKKELGQMDQLMIFGKPHTHFNSITGQGIIATLNGLQLTFDSFDPAFRSSQHLKWQLIYDEADFRNVLAISEDGKQRFLLHQKRAVPMDIYSTTADDRAYQKQISDFNKARKEEIIQTYISDDAITQEVIENTPLAMNDFDESVLKLMFTNNGQQKESIQDAKRLIEKKNTKRIEKQKVLVNKTEVNNWNDTQLAYLQSKTDFNKYLD